MDIFQFYISSLSFVYSRQVLSTPKPVLSHDGRLQELQRNFTKFTNGTFLNFLSLMRNYPACRPAVCEKFQQSQLRLSKCNINHCYLHGLDCVLVDVVLVVVLEVVKELVDFCHHALGRLPAPVLGHLASLAPQQQHHYSRRHVRHCRGRRAERLQLRQVRLQNDPVQNILKLLPRFYIFFHIPVYP